MSTFGNPLTEYNPQMEYEYAGEQESGEGVFNEQQEMELASELLEVTNEQELENFLGSLIGMAGKALGGIVKGPIGGMIGSNLAGMAGQALGLELEGLSGEDREFETARQFVKFAGEAVKNALEAPPNADPAAVAHAATVEAARLHAPGFFGGQPPVHSRSGRWIRRGGKIVLFGV
jgi:hypothetical protein